MRSFGIALAGLLVAGCNGIGDGNKLETLAVVPVVITTSTETVASTKIFRCVRDQLRAYGKFTDGEVGEYTTRGRWSSSDESVVHVSNGEIGVDDVPGQDEGVVFTAGTMTPIAPGTAIVSFDYVGLHQQIEVTVEDLDNSAISISPGDSSMAPGSLEALRASALIDGSPVDITNTAEWTFVTPNDEVATIDKTTGLVSAVAPGAPLTAKATFTACDAAPTATVTVKPIQTLILSKEFDSAELVIPTSEKLIVTADFGDGTQQDLSVQATYCVAPDPQAFIGFLATNTLRNYVLAQTEGTIGMFAMFPPVSSFTPGEGADPFTCANPPPSSLFKQSNDMALTAVKASLCSIAVSPSSATIVFGSSQQFKATGTFTKTTVDATHPAAEACDGVGETLFTQDITRHVVWTSSDATVAGVVNASANFLLAGVGGGVNPAGGTVTITATSATTALPLLQQVTGANVATFTVTPKP